MKAFFFPLAILLLFTYGSFSLQNYIQKSANQLLGFISQTETSLDDNEWPESQKNFLFLKKHWEKTKTFWSLFMNHSELEAIDQLLAKVLYSFREKNAHNLLGEIEDLKYHIKHIPKREEFTLINIL